MDGFVERLGLAVELAEHRNFGFQNRGIDWLGQVIHRSGAITRENLLVLAGMGGDENDGYVLGFPPLLDELGQLEATGARHLHVQDDQSKIGVEEGHQGFLRGRGFCEPIVRVIENRLENRKVLRLVIHDQYFDWVRHIEEPKLRAGERKNPPPWRRAERTKSGESA